MKWDFSFDVNKKVNKFKKFHESTNHYPLLQMIKSPRSEYIVKDLDSTDRPVTLAIQPEDVTRIDGSFSDVMLQRRTSWNFSNKDLSSENLKQLLYYSFGVSDQDHMKRVYPSGGQFYAIEIYVVPTKRSTDNGLMDSYVYKYNVNHHQLVEHAPIDLDKLSTISASTDVGHFTFENAQCLVFLVANPEDISVKYMDFTYRIMLLEAGHMAQNFLLTATALKISSVPMGGLHEESVKKLLQLKEEGLVLYTLIGG